MKIIQLNKETNEIQRIISLRESRNKRYKHKEFIIEGHAALDEAVGNKWKIKSFYYNKEIKLTRWASSYLSKNLASIAYAIPTKLMNKISDKSSINELIAIGETQFNDFSTYNPIGQTVIIVLDRPKSAGNLGMIIRSAAVFGAHAIVISGHGADEYDPQCIRSSVGTFFSIPIYRVSGFDAFLRKFNNIKINQNVKIIATGDQGEVTLQQADFKAEILYLILGNETSGISHDYKNIADMFIKIPSAGKFTSLNIGAAASIILYEVFLAVKTI